MPPSPIANTIRKLRFERGEMTQQELAERVGVTRQTINAIETEKYDPSLPLALKMGELFDLYVEQMFSLDDVRAAEARRRGAK